MRRREYLIALHGVEVPAIQIVDPTDQYDEIPTVVKVPCWHCLVLLDPDEFEVDRWPICGKQQGSLNFLPDGDPPDR